MSDDNIIFLRSEADYPIQKRRKANCACSHITEYARGPTPPTWIDEATRMIECKVCGAQIDPFDFLWHIASKGMGLSNDITNLKETIRISKAQVSVLEDEIKSLKSERNRLKRERA